MQSIYISCKCIKYTLGGDDTQMLKKVPLDKISGTKNASFLISQAPTHHSFSFNLQFLYELKHKVHFSQTICGIFHFRFGFAFIKVYFCSTKCMYSLALKRHNFFQN